MSTLAIIAMLLMYLFAAKQVTDTESPRIAALVHDVLQRNLEKGPKTTLHVRPLSAGQGRNYELTIHPASRLVDDTAGMARLLYRAAEIVHEETGGKKVPVTVTCVAVLPGSERRVTFDRELHQVPEPDVGDVPASGGAE